MQAVLLEGGQQDGGGGTGRQAQRQEGHQHARCTGVVGGFRPGHALDGSLTELLGVLAETLFQGVTEEGGNLRAARRERPEGEAQGGAAQPRPPASAPVVAFHGRAALQFDHVLRFAVATGDIQRLADGKEADHDGHEVDTVQQLGEAQGEAGLAALQVGADQSDGQAEEEAQEAAQGRVAEGGADGHEGQHDHGELGAGRNLHRDVGDGRGEEGEQHGADGARDERTDGSGRQRGGGASPPGHLVAFQRGDDAGGLARRIQENAGGGAAEHPAVVNPGEHDEGTDRGEFRRDGQQQCHRQGRADAGQYAHQGSEGHADQGV